MKGMQWLKLILGLWVLISPFLVANILLVSNVIVGILIISIECFEVFGGKPKPQV